MKTVKVYGPGCKRCEATEKMVTDAADKLGVEVELEKVTDQKSIAMAGVMSTPRRGGGRQAGAHRRPAGPGEAGKVAPRMIRAFVATAVLAVPTEVLEENRLSRPARLRSVSEGAIRSAISRPRRRAFALP